MIYLLNFNITYNYFATCFDSNESSSGINFKNYCTYCFTVFMSYSFLSNYCNRDPFLHYKTRANVYMVLGNLSPRQEGGSTTKGRKPTPDPPPIRGTNIPIKFKLTRAHTITEYECNQKIYQRVKTPHPPNTNNIGHQKQLPTTPLPNTIQTLALIL